MDHIYTKKRIHYLCEIQISMGVLYFIWQPYPSLHGDPKGSHGGDSQLTKAPGHGLAVTREQVCFSPLTGDQTNVAQVQEGPTRRLSECSPSSSGGPGREATRTLGDVPAGDSLRTRAAPRHLSRCLTSTARHVLGFGVANTWALGWLVPNQLCPLSLPAPPFPTLHNRVAAVTSQGPLRIKGHQGLGTQ